MHSHRAEAPNLEEDMKHSYRFPHRFLPKKGVMAVLSILSISTMLSFVLTVPLNATQRMVIAEEYTNSG